MAKKIRTANFLVHTVDMIRIPVDGRSNTDIMADVEAEGKKMGSTSLRNLLSGSAKVSCGFELMKLELTPPEEAKPTDTPEPEVAPAVEAPAPAADGPKIRPMRKGTKNDLVFKMLCKGATVKEIAAELKWTEGAVSSVVFWEPNNKGYGLDKEKVEGRGTVNFLTIAGKRISEAELVYTQ